jgi:hypothetical protein
MSCGSLEYLTKNTKEDATTATGVSAILHEK